VVLVIQDILQGNTELAAAGLNARVIPSVAYTAPEVAWVGFTEGQAKAQGIKVKKGLFPWTASGRAVANGGNEGVTKLSGLAAAARHAPAATFRGCGLPSEFFLVYRDCVGAGVPRGRPGGTALPARKPVAR
jgi:hypothetical protein